MSDHDPTVRWWRQHSYSDALFLACVVIAFGLGVLWGGALF